MPKTVPISKITVLEFKLKFNNNMDFIEFHKVYPHDW